MVTQIQATKRRIKLRQELASVQTPEPQSYWDKCKSLFKYSLTIFLARITAISGFITGVVGSLDLSPLATFDYSTDFKPRQIIGLGAGILIGGVVFELARRRSLTN